MIDLPVCPKCKHRVVPAGSTDKCPHCGSSTVQPCGLNAELQKFAEFGIIRDPKKHPEKAARARRLAQKSFGALLIYYLGVLVLKNSARIIHEIGASSTAENLGLVFGTILAALTLAAVVWVIRRVLKAEALGL